MEKNVNGFKKNSKSFHQGVLCPSYHMATDKQVSYEATMKV